MAKQHLGLLAHQRFLLVCGLNAKIVAGRETAWSGNLRLDTSRDNVQALWMASILVPPTSYRPAVRFIFIR
jgi:hypothetical protein